MRRAPFLLSFLALTACGNSSEPASTAGDASVDSGTTDGGRDARYVSDGRPIYPEIVCGTGPWATYELQTIGQTIGELSKEQPMLPINVSMSACPEVKGVTDGEGYAILKLPIGKPNSLRFDAAGWLPTRWHELTPEAWSSEPTFTIMATDSAKELPGFAADKGVILVDIAASSAGTCFSNDGVAITVKDHPEAVVTYHAASSPFAPVKDATGTTPSGLVSIAGLATGTKVTLVGTKKDCEVVPYATPGTILVEAGVVSRTQMMVRQPLPSCGPGPWVLLGGATTTRETTGMTGTAIPDVDISFSACPGVSVKTDSAGKWQAWVGANMPAARRFQKDGFFVTNLSEQGWPQDYEKLDLAIRNTTTWSPLMPGVDTTHGYVLVGISAPKTGDCIGPEGVTITVKDHPDAKVLYMDGEPPKAVTGTVTTKRGLAYISGLKPGELLPGQITGAREGCTYSLDGSVDTGKARLEAGALTIVSLYSHKAP